MRLYGVILLVTIVLMSLANTRAHNISSCLELSKTFYPRVHNLLAFLYRYHLVLELYFCSSDISMNSSIVGGGINGIIASFCSGNNVDTIFSIIFRSVGCASWTFGIIYRIFPRYDCRCYLWVLKMLWAWFCEQPFLDYGCGPFYLLAIFEKKAISGPLYLSSRT